MSFRNNPSGNQLVTRGGVANGSTDPVEVTLQSSWWSLQVTIVGNAGVSVTAQGDQSGFPYVVNEVTANVFRIPLVAGLDSSLTIRIANASGSAVVFYVSALLAPDGDYPAQVIGTAGEPVPVYQLGGRLFVNPNFADALVHTILANAGAGLDHALKRVTWHAIGGTNNLLIGAVTGTVYSSTTGNASDDLAGQCTFGGEGLNVQVVGQPATTYGMSLFYDDVATPTLL